MKTKLLAAGLTSAMLLNLVACGESSEKFTATTTGYHGDVTLTISVADGIISDIEIEHTETEGLGSVALEKLSANVLETQNLAIDAVSGATLSSNAFFEAMEITLEEAGFNVNELKNALNETVKEEDQELTVKTLVVGGGLSGLTTALQLAILGEEVLLIERGDVLGGATLTAHGYMFGVDTKAQEEAGIEDSVEKFMELVEVSGAGKSDLDVAKMVAEQSGEAIDWIMDLGLGIEDEIGVGAYYPHNVDRVYTADGNGSAMVKVLTDALNEYVESGLVQIIMQTEAQTLLTDDNGVVVGAVATGKTGNIITINAEETVLATGGYGHNEELLNKYQFENVITNAPVSHTGLGLQMLEDLGAEIISTPMAGQAGAIPNNGFDKGLIFNTNQYDGVIWTDVDGQRVANETGTSNALVWKNAPENTVYMVFAESMINDEKPLFVGVDKSQTLDKLNELVDGGFAIKANSVEELAENAKLHDLVSTVMTYNEYCETGVDEDFGKTDGLIAFEGDTYYAIKTYPWIVQTTEGIENNLDRRPLTADGTPIEGVYVVGDMVGMNILTGGTAIGGAGLTPAITSGLQVAEQIANK